MFFSAEANCAQIGVSTGSVAESGGVVFSFPCGCDCCCGAYERSLLDLFILPKMAEMLVLDLLLFILVLSVFVGEREPYRDVPVAFSERLEGEDGCGWALYCLSPRTRAEELCGWSGGRMGIFWERAPCWMTLEECSCVMSGETGRDLLETRDMRNLEDLFRRCCGRSGVEACCCCCSEGVAMLPDMLMLV